MRERVSLLGLIALSQSPADAELFDTFTRLRDRGFLPPAPLMLPVGSPDTVARALTRRTPAELAALAASFVALPDPGSPTATTIAEVLIAAKDPRAATLCAQIAAVTPAKHPGEPGWAALAHLRLALERGASPAELENLAQTLAGLPPLAEAEGLARLLTAALEASDAVGARWLVPLDGGRFVAHLLLGFERRPALREAFGSLGARIIELLPTLALAGHLLAQAELFLASRRLEDADALYGGLDHDERARLERARAELLEGATFTLPALAARTLPDSDLEQHLQAVEVGTTSFMAGALRERLGDRGGAARVWAQLATSRLATNLLQSRDSTALASLEGDTLDAAFGAVRLVSELPRELRVELAEALSRAVVPDEVRLAASPELRQVAELSLRLNPDPIAAARLFAVASMTATPAAPVLKAADADPHHPAQRLAAASDLLAEGRLEPAANILAALLRKAEPETPERLFAVVAGALESDSPPDELLGAAQKALEDPPRAHRLIAALRRSATAAFALHEELLGLAKDPSRPDPLRFAALESWLNIWAETTTPPNPDLLATLREVEPAMIAAAAVAIGSAQRAGDPVEALRSFLDRRFASPAAWSDALLELMLGAG